MLPAGASALFQGAPPTGDSSFLQSICAHCYRKLDARRRRGHSLLCPDCEKSWLHGLKRRLGSQRLSSRSAAQAS